MTKKLLRIATLCMLFLGILVSPAAADDLADAKALIGKQLELVKKGDVAGLKPGFSARQQEKITEATVKAAQKEAVKYTLDDLVEKVESKEGGIKIKMKGGRTLTTLIKVDGKWVADTVWFK
ncbi:MAG: hypothetical protein M4D80_11790 [Myxococcota bacterium]|nr:hypothetical protein [Myxococcota bacterium]